MMDDDDVQFSAFSFVLRSNACRREGQTEIVENLLRSTQLTQSSSVHVIGSPCRT